MKINTGDYVHFQWTGSDTMDLAAIGAGGVGSERNNIVQIAGPGRTLPIPFAEQTLFPNSSVAYYFANLGTPAEVRLPYLVCVCFF